MEEKLNRLFLACFGLVMVGVLVGAAHQWQDNSMAALIAAFLLGCALVVFLRVVGVAVEAMPRDMFRFLFALLAFGWLLFLCYMGQRLTQALIMDMGVVYASLPDFLNGFPLGGDNAGYYMVCNNNLGIALCLTAFYKFSGVLVGIAPDMETGLALGILFNCAMIWAAVMLLCLAAYMLTGKRLPALVLLGLSAAFAPFYLYAPQFYSDTLVMPFLALAVVLFLWLERAPALYKAALLGAVVFIAYALKGSAGVFLPAAAIVWLLRAGTAKEKLLPIAAMAVAFTVLLGGYKAWQNTFLDWDSADSYIYPTELWLCYGSHDMGDYSQADVDAANALATKAERQSMLRGRIVQNYTSRSVAGNLVFFARKASHTWGEGKYDADEFTATPKFVNWTAKFTLPGQPLFMPFHYYCQICQFLLLALVAFYCVEALRGAYGRCAAILPMAIWGGMVLLSIWETKPRYALHFSPLLLLCGALCLCSLADESLWNVFQKVPATAK